MGTPVHQALAAIGGNSPYLSDLILREYPTFQNACTKGPDAALQTVFHALDTLPITQPRRTIAAALRQAKRQAALIIALADIGGAWQMEHVTENLTLLAEKTLGIALRHLLRAAHDTGSIHLPDPNQPDHACGFVALGMGKLGGRELNYSSDIDLILIYQADSPTFAATDAIARTTSRLARDLVTLMQARDADGYVFRTDLRLRPDPSATPPAVSLLGALSYYESMGQNWERAAMIKARPVAGDRELGQRFLDAIRPFVWRRGLDFATVADIHALKQRINATRTTTLGRVDDPAMQVAGYNVKLGEGGIRDIEFLVQTLQIVWGGRDPSLHVAATLHAGARLVETGHLDPVAFQQLTDCYRFLRTVEHRLQMLNDQQTHQIPDTPAEITRIAIFLGYPDATAFTTALLHCIEVVRHHYRAVFDTVPDPAENGVSDTDLDFRGDDPEPARTVASLRALGFKDHARIISGVRGWLAGHVRALRSQRARDLLTTLLPAILAALGQQTEPDEAFNRFDRFISALPSGVQPMSLFQHNRALLQRVAAVLGAAPILSDHLARFPSALEGLIADEGPRDAWRTLRRTLRATTPLEDVIETVRSMVKEREFLISVATLDARIDVNQAGRQRSALAYTALRTLLPVVLEDFASRNGRVPGGEVAIIVLGKAGSLEMMAGSDLDLMFIYDHPQDVIESTGAKPMAAGQWFIRAVQTCIAALTAPGLEGPMYPLDMRLRPSGNKGPLAVSLSSFRRYHETDAWTWERMALTRARVVAGRRQMRRKVRHAIAEALSRPVAPAKILADAAAMRARIRKEMPLGGPWDTKLRPGGMVDVAFIAQTQHLIHRRTGNVVPDQAIGIMLRHLADAGLMDRGDADTLIQADLLWRTIQGMLRLTVGEPKSAMLPPASAEPLLRAVAALGIEAADIAALLHTADVVAQRVSHLFTRLVGNRSAAP